MKKRCPFVVTKKESSHVWYDAKCIVSYSEFKIKHKGFATQHGCFNLTHNNCEYFLKAIQEGFWQHYLTKKIEQYKQKQREKARLARREWKAKKSSKQTKP